MFLVVLNQILSILELLYIHSLVVLRLIVFPLDKILSGETLFFSNDTLVKQPVKLPGFEVLGIAFHEDERWIVRSRLRPSVRISMRIRTYFQLCYGKDRIHFPVLGKIESISKAFYSFEDLERINELQIVFSSDKPSSRNIVAVMKS